MSRSVIGKGNEPLFFDVHFACFTPSLKCLFFPEHGACAATLYVKEDSMNQMFFLDSDENMLRHFQSLFSGRLFGL
ncbi:hypothetical protein TRIATDRAFT_297673 [Trichoderma atroviride IMI 206040]|uniref:Uncharacterized protein n=1 Tax=Hypocrea atroviridis (strain ATCC 20476 / IMI 206040) TaxID=452589 RepID=G9NJ38_HYPAI|nr:uncharacterized protein TRIATDRAFT_297673 [Trichoderma atroviride IMI 206040]EHK48914.1 hypothetical protein TRIATDRAFT_297673 [Trichoderma atroviride IMI 206040]